MVGLDESVKVYSMRFELKKAIESVEKWKLKDAYVLKVLFDLMEEPKEDERLNLDDSKYRQAIARYLGIQKNEVGTSIKHLRKLGYFESKRNVKDERRTMIYYNKKHYEKINHILGLTNEHIKNHNVYINDFIDENGEVIEE